VAQCKTKTKNIPAVGSEYGSYLFYIPPAILFLFGIALIVLGWYTADGDDDYSAVTLTAIQISQIILIFALALYEVYAN
jgi:hypothetical protein